MLTLTYTYPSLFTAAMRMISGFVGMCVLYPSVAIAAALCTGTAATALPAVALLGLSGHAALKYPVEDFLRSVKGSYLILSKNDNVDGLRKKRKNLQREIRAFADDHVEPELKGWWKDPEGFDEKLKNSTEVHEKELREMKRIVTQTSIDEAKLEVSSYDHLRV